jgi:hypothetical protein
MEETKEIRKSGMRLTKLLLSVGETLIKMGVLVLQLLLEVGNLADGTSGGGWPVLGQAMHPRRVERSVNRRNTGYCY